MVQSDNYFNWNLIKGIGKMKTEILANGNLKLTIDKIEQAEFRALHAIDPDNFGSDNNMYEIFEDIISNSEYDWIAPEQIGALTDAPILATFGINDNDRGDREIENAYGFMDYCIISLQDQLLEYGEAILTKG